MHKQTLGNIKDYSKNKVMCTLTKPKAFTSVKIVEDINDAWFLYILTYMKKSGEITKSSMIIRKDYNDWITFLEHNGFDTFK